MAERKSFGSSGSSAAGDGRTRDVVSLRAECQRRHDTPAPRKGIPFPLQIGFGFGFVGVFSVAVMIGMAWPSIRSAVATLVAWQGCTIKGNLSENGDIYHMPGDERYAETRIDTSRGEQWFCTAAEAEAAGWRRARPAPANWK